MATLLVVGLLSSVCGHDKGDTLVLGGSHGCHSLLLKTHKKKGDVLVMQDCHKKKEKKV